MGDPPNYHSIVSAFFFGFTVYTAVTSDSGVFGFWINHTESLWGNQIWFDLIYSVSLGWTLLLPRARAVELRILPWLILVLATASIGLLAMMAQVLYLEQNQHYESL